MSRAHTLLALSAVAATTACVHRAPPPPPAIEVQLAGGRATYRSYGTSGALCDAEPRWLADELASVNALLGKYLQLAEKPAEAEWTTQEISAFAEAAASLRPVIDIHGANLANARKCSFSREPVFKDIFETAKEVVPRAEEQLALADSLLLRAAEP